VARVLLNNTELEVTEDTDEILARIVKARDGLRRGSGTIIAPPGWIRLTDPLSDDPVYVQVAKVSFVR
jgi:hypothetical protein